MLGGVVLLVLALLLLPVLGRKAAAHLAPTLRSRLITLLSQRFGSSVALDTLDVQYRHGLVVQGGGLQIQSVLHGVPGEATHPMLRVRKFGFRVGLLSLLSPTPTIRGVTVRGVLLDLPQIAARGHAEEAGQTIEIDSATVDDAHITFQTNDQKRAPLVFDFPHGELRGIRPGQPFTFDITVDNGAPIGLTQTSGTIGPWNFDDPRQTPVRGQFAFLDKDVSSVHGLHGRLTLHGTYHGTFSKMQAEGSTDDPVFGLDVSSHTVDLHTKFLMLMDAEAGVIHLQRVDANFLHTRFLCRGDVTKSRTAPGYDLDLSLQVTDGRLEDALTLGSRTAPPVLRGGLRLKGVMQMTAGPETVSRKLRLVDTRFQITGAAFSDSAVQMRVNEMSERAQGHPKNADAQHASAAPMQAEGPLTLSNAVMRFQQIKMTMPGAQSTVSGQYSLSSTAFQFIGTVHTDATASEMTTGFKSMLAKPFNKMFSHGKQGATLPLRVTGSGNQAQFDVTLPGGKQMEAPSANK